MSFFSKGSSSPYMMFPKKLPSYPRDLLTKATYQIVQGPQGAPQARIEMRFTLGPPSVVNPSMALGLLLDRSGSMTETYNDGHVFNAADAVYTLVGSSGFELGFYDTRPSYAGHVDSRASLRQKIDSNRPSGGGTAVTSALRGMIQRLRAIKPEVYVIVVTDGEFSDKTAVQQLIMNELLPSVPLDRPNALRLHFVGAGEEVDHEFLKQLEADVTNKGATLVRQHHHTHLRHAHTDIADELSTVYLGVGSHVRLEDASHTMTRGGILNAGPLHEGPVVESTFLPRHPVWLVEYGAPHPSDLSLTLSYRDGAGQEQSFAFATPLPASTRQGQASNASPEAADTGSGVASSPPPLGASGRGGLHFPWRRATADEKEAQRAQQAHTAQVREAELRRQSADMNDLARGGIPSSARERLGALKASAGAFTSDLAPDEIGLLRSKGFQSRGLVTGSAMYHVGTAYASSSGDGEVRVLSDAYNTATRLAVSRMSEELRVLGAHGAVGVRLTMVRHEWADKTVEVQLIGTAVDGPGSPPTQPWLSDLSGQEWWALQRAGYDAVGLVYGHCTWFVLTTWQDEQIGRMYSNLELQHHSQGLSRARHIAMNLLTDGARAVGASGVTGMHIARHIEEVRLSGPGENPVYEYEHHNVTLSIVGTAIALRRDAPRTVTATRSVLSLRDNRIVPMAVHAASADFE